MISWNQLVCERTSWILTQVLIPSQPAGWFILWRSWNYRESRLRDSGRLGETLSLPCLRAPGAKRLSLREKRMISEKSPKGFPQRESPLVLHLSFNETPFQQAHYHRQSCQLAVLITYTYREIVSQGSSDILECLQCENRGKINRNKEVWWDKN